MLSTELFKLISSRLGTTSQQKGMWLNISRVLEQERSSVLPALGEPSFLYPIRVIKYSNNLIRLLGLTETAIVDAAKHESVMLATAKTDEITNAFRADFLLRATLFAIAIQPDSQMLFRTVPLLQNLLLDLALSIQFLHYATIQPIFFGRMNVIYEHGYPVGIRGNPQMQNAERFVMFSGDEVAGVKLGSYITIKSQNPYNLMKRYAELFLEAWSREPVPVDTNFIQIYFLIRPHTKLRAAIRSYRNLLDITIKSGKFMNLDATRPTDEDGDVIEVDPSDSTSKIGAITSTVLQKFGTIDDELAEQVLGLSFTKGKMPLSALRTVIQSAATGAKDELALIVQSLLSSRTIDGKMVVTNIRSVRTMDVAQTLARKPSATQKSKLAEKAYQAQVTILNVLESYRNTTRASTRSGFHSVFMLYLTFFIQKMERR